MRFGQILLRKARRESTSGGFIPEIDGLRFVAIAAVVLFHLSGTVASKTGRANVFDPLALVLSHGDIGVRLFFVISGFVIALPFCQSYVLGTPRLSIARYFGRRLTRLEPPYIINLLFLFLLIPLFTGNTAASLLPHLIASMTYLHNLIYAKMSAVNDVAWSLEIELQFYVLAPLLVTVFGIRAKRLRRTILGAAIVGFAALTFLVGDAYPRFNLSILGHAHFFLTGFLLVDVYLTEWKSQPATSRWWDLVAVVSWLSLFGLLFIGRIGLFFAVIPVFIAYCAAFRGTVSNWFFRRPTIYVIGGMCYTIYLYHNIVIWTFGRILARTGLLDTVPLWMAILGVSAVVVPIILCLSTVLFIFIEKPCMKKDWPLTLYQRVWAQWNALSRTDA